MLALLSITEFFGDFNFVLKIFVLVMIISFVLNHLGKGPMAWVLIAAMTYFILFDAWQFFGPVYLLYMFIVLGFVGFVIDYFFMATPLRAKKAKAGEDEGGSSKDSEDFHRHHQAQAHAGGHKPGPRPMPPPG